MAYSIQTAVSDGTLEVLDLSIKYMDKSHIFVYVDDVLVDGSAYSYVWLTDTRIQVVPAVANGSTLKVIRKTLTDEMWHEFSKGARFSTTSMDENFEQLLFLAQEYSEGIYVSDFYKDVDMHLKRILNLGDPIHDGDAVNLKTLKEYLPNADLIPPLAERIAAAASASAAAVAAIPTDLASTASGKGAEMVAFKQPEDWAGHGTVQSLLEYKGADYFATFFRNDSSSLFLYTSKDGINFEPLRQGAVYSVSGRQLRDPSIIYKDGWWWCVYSDTPIANFSTTYFGVAKSSNLVDWEFAFNIDTGIDNAWAPEWFVDADGSVHVVIALNFNTHLLPIDLHAGTAGTPVSLGIPGNSIDGTIKYENGAYYLFIKNETTKYIERYQAASKTGPYTKTGSGNWAGWGANVEGPCLMQLPDGSWRIYFDGYNDGAYYASEASSLGSNTWTAKVTLPQSGTVRHGSVVRLADVARRVDVLSAKEIAIPATSHIEDGAERSAQVITSRTNSPLGSAFMRFWSDSDAAIFQSRNYSGGDGIDFVNRRNSGYASLEIVEDANLAATVIKFWGILKSYKVEFPKGILTEAWQTPNFSNGWGDGSVPFAYKANSEGLVKFAGIVAGGTATQGTVIFTLPVGWRPERIVVFPVVSNDTAFGSVGITTSGDVVYLSGGNAKLDLSSISFYRP